MSDKTIFDRDAVQTCVRWRRPAMEVLTRWAGRQSADKNIGSSFWPASHYKRLTSCFLFQAGRSRGRMRPPSMQMRRRLLHGGGKQQQRLLRMWAGCPSLVKIGTCSFLYFTFSLSFPRQKERKYVMASNTNSVHMGLQLAMLSTRWAGRQSHYENYLYGSFSTHHQSHTKNSIAVKKILMGCPFHTLDFPLVISTQLALWLAHQEVSGMQIHVKNLNKSF